MIEYQSGLFGFNNLRRVHGSAAYKVILPTIASSGILLFMSMFAFDDDPDSLFYENTVQHPYGIGVFIGFFGFLLTFRLNYAYGRYWDGCGAIHLMMSKWLDCAMCLAAFHYQSSAFDDIKPDAFGKHPKLDPSRIKRNRDFQLDEQEAKDHIQQALEEMDQNHEGETWVKKFLNVSIGKNAGLKFSLNSESTSSRGSSRSSNAGKINADSTRSWNKQKGKSINIESTRSWGKSINKSVNADFDSSSRIPIPVRFQGSGSSKQQNGSRGLKDFKQSGGATLHLEKSARMPSPSLFLQEAAHLVSLLSAVAMSTLRNDVEIADSPLVEYIPGSAWPPVDPDDLSEDVKKRYGEDNFFWRTLYFMLSINRSERHRTLYNAARPFGVLGGVSDSEIELLQRARGPYAKTSLCTMWLQEFITRESLKGSVGDVHSPITSRLYQFISDGMVGYNQARKISYVPFPFVNAQMISLFSLVIIPLFPLLYYTYVNTLWFACILNGITVMCFLGLHEVARELENPFQNVPNDIPLTTFQAHLNESLVAMYAGYHPDAWWELVKTKH